MHTCWLRISRGPLRDTQSADESHRKGDGRPRVSVRASLPLVSGEGDPVDACALCTVLIADGEADIHDAPGRKGWGRFRTTAKRLQFGTSTLRGFGLLSTPVDVHSPIPGHTHTHSRHLPVSFLRPSTYLPPRRPRSSLVLSFPFTVYRIRCETRV